MAVNGALDLDLQQSPEGGAGAIVADRYGGAIVRPAPAAAMIAATRRAQTLRFARFAAARLRRVEDPAA